ncbi:hypothetical protein K1T71_006925 [Dendrolimus kikuchii]|uniref:Uncharacterized protein n=1 Tax=Dendrolimus kikuchii TaxID=765133 RepID=A0ACC1CZA8_9NEOP|nr:hypothetical protein K1T71_006925 [Dendrolimus kikuchii]
MSFSDKVVLITGASRGIGAAIAIEFAKEGANVVIVGRNQSKLDKVGNECLKLGSKPLVIRADVSKDVEPKEIVKKTIDAYGKIDVLINNAGIYKPASILKADYLTCFDDIMKTNIRAVVNLTNVAAPHLVESKGNIINISSIAGIKVAIPGFSSYSMSKAALDHFTRSIALELSPYGVRVNAINPGPVMTDIFDTAGLPNAIESLSKGTALGGASEPQEIADLAVFLASDKARSVTGSLYIIDRGVLVK